LGPGGQRRVDWKHQRPYRPDAGFVAAVLEGIEGTLNEVIERVEISELRASLDVLQNTVTALRVSIEPDETRGLDTERTEEAVVLDV
jgi:hypothetical protein